MLALLQATNSVWIPWSILHISLYEQAKQMALQGRAWCQSMTGMRTGATQLTSCYYETVGLHWPGRGHREPMRANAGGMTQAEPLPAWILGSCSASAAAVATSLTHPADVIKTRLQVLTAVSPSQQARLTAIQVAQTTWLREGPRVSHELRTSGHVITYKPRVLAASASANGKVAFAVLLPSLATWCRPGMAS